MNRMIRSIRVDIDKWNEVKVLHYDSVDEDSCEFNVSHYVCQDDLYNGKVQNISGTCNVCGKTNMEHGWLGTAILGTKVCPDDYIMNVEGKRVVIKPNVYKLLFGDEPKNKELKVNEDSQISMFG